MAVNKEIHGGYQLHGNCSYVRHIPRLSSGDTSRAVGPKCTPMMKGIALLSILHGFSPDGHKLVPQCVR